MATGHRRVHCAVVAAVIVIAWFLAIIGWVLVVALAWVLSTAVESEHAAHELAAWWREQALAMDPLLIYRSPEE